MQLTAVIPAIRSAQSAFDPLADLNGKPVLAHVFARATQVLRLKSVLIATTTLAQDDPIAAFCAELKIPCFRGEPENFLGLLLAVFKSGGEKGCVLIYPDQPLIDPLIIDQVANLVEMTDGMLDWVGTNLSPVYPGGMDVEGFTLAALEDSDRRCADPAVRAQGTLYIRQNSRLYRILSIKTTPELNRPDLSFRVEKEEDLTAIAAIVRNFQDRNDYSLSEIIAFKEGAAAKSRP
jgi:spore coat polysaccharide biosynthesis protein SpsF